MKETGQIIRFHRMKKGISQAELTQGICVPSYLSKIENSEIEASLEIEEQLLKRLGIMTLSERENTEISNLLDKVIECLYSLENKKAQEVFQVVPESVYYSDRLIEYIAMRMYLRKQEEDTEINFISGVLNYLHEEQAFLVNLMLYLWDKNRTDNLEKALRIKPLGVVHFTYAMMLAKRKDFVKELELLKLAEVAFLSEGRLYGVIQSKRHYAIVLALIGRKREAYDAFQVLYRLIDSVHNSLYESMKRSVRFNILYLEFQMGQVNELGRFCEMLISENLFKTSLPFHTLYEIYGDCEPDRAKHYIHEGLKHFCDETSYEHHLLKLDLYRLENGDYIHQKNYQRLLLKTIGLVSKTNSYGIYYDLQVKLIAYYKANKFYKAALEVTEALNQQDF